MNETIEQVLSGNIGMDEFLEQLKSAPDLQEYIRSFVPDEAKKDPTHSFWKIVPYESMRRNDFDYYRFLFWALHSNDRFGSHLSIFSRLQRAYLYYYPDVLCTSKYEDEFNLYLDTIQDCFDGPEVQAVVECVIDEALQLRVKSQRKKHAKTAIKESFHLENNKRPRWVQGPEWPMGSNSPMAFVSQKRSGELVNFEFRDVDSGEVRIVKQFY